MLRLIIKAAFTMNLHPIYSSHDAFDTIQLIFLFGGNAHLTSCGSVISHFVHDVTTHQTFRILYANRSGTFQICTWIQKNSYISLLQFKFISENILHLCTLFSRFMWSFFRSFRNNFLLWVHCRALELEMKKDSYCE